jgi:hypothetical protein
MRRGTVLSAINWGFQRGPFTGFSPFFFQGGSSRGLCKGFSRVRSTCSNSLCPFTPVTSHHSQSRDSGDFPYPDGTNPPRDGTVRDQAQIPSRPLPCASLCLPPRNTSTVPERLSKRYQYLIGRVVNSDKHATEQDVTVPKDEDLVCESALDKQDMCTQPSYRNSFPRTMNRMAFLLPLRTTLVSQVPLPSLSPKAPPSDEELSADLLLVAESDEISSSAR